jgi:hypothetical protein
MQTDRSESHAASTPNERSLASWTGETLGHAEERHET